MLQPAPGCLLQDKKRQGKQAAMAQQVIELVKEERIEQPRVGTRKLYEALHPSFEASGLK
ncbi:MAG: hypothetical protein PHS05_04710 [Bacteroidales bacterium]|nr:hypothetical protein [Bacteroidales bacterium]